MENQVSSVRLKLRRIKLQAKALRDNFFKPNPYSLRSSERVGVCFLKPSDMCVSDRLMLYSLVRGLKPERVLEIGIRWGGGARIIAAAMEDNGAGKAVGVDPEPEAFMVPKRHLFGRYTIVEGFSPQITETAIARLGGSPDLVLIDALHTGDAVHADFLGVLPFLNDGAHILFHDAYHQGVSTAIQDVLDANDSLVDLGFVTRHPEVGFPISYQGLRLVRKGKVCFQTLIKKAYETKGEAPPPFHPALRNWDVWANKIGLGAEPAEVERVLEGASLRP